MTFWPTVRVILNIHEPPSPLTLSTHLDRWPLMHFLWDSFNRKFLAGEVFSAHQLAIVPHTYSWTGAKVALGPSYWLTNLGSSAHLLRGVVAILVISKTLLECLGKVWRPITFLFLDQFFFKFDKKSSVVSLFQNLQGIGWTNRKWKYRGGLKSTKFTITEMDLISSNLHGQSYSLGKEYVNLGFESGSIISCKKFFS